MTCHDRAVEFMDRLFTAIEHGDADHRAWLRAKLTEMIPALDDAFLDAYSDGGESYSTGEW